MGWVWLRCLYYECQFGVSSNQIQFHSLCTWSVVIHEVMERDKNQMSQAWLLWFDSECQFGNALVRTHFLYVHQDGHSCLGGKGIVSPIKGKIVGFGNHSNLEIQSIQQCHESYKLMENYYFFHEHGGSNWADVGVRNPSMANRRLACKKSNGTNDEVAGWEVETDNNEWWNWLCQILKNGFSCFNCTGIPIMSISLVSARWLGTLVWIQVQVQLLGDPKKNKMVKAQEGNGSGVKRSQTRKAEKFKGKEKVETNKHTQRERGRKSDQQNILLHAYGVGMPAQVKSLISGWEQDLNTKVEDDIPKYEMEPMVTDPGNTR